MPQTPQDDGYGSVGKPTRRRNQATPEMIRQVAHDTAPKVALYCSMVSAPWLDWPTFIAMYGARAYKIKKQY